MDFIGVPNIRFIDYRDTINTANHVVDFSSKIRNLLYVCKEKLFHIYVSCYSTEFDSWYAESFLSQFDEPQTSSLAGHGMRQGMSMPFNPNRMVS